MCFFLSWEACLERTKLPMAPLPSGPSRAGAVEQLGQAVRSWCVLAVTRCYLHQRTAITVIGCFALAFLHLGRSSASLLHAEGVHKCYKYASAFGSGCGESDTLESQCTCRSAFASQLRYLTHFQTATFMHWFFGDCRCSRSTDKHTATLDCLFC